MAAFHQGLQEEEGCVGNQGRGARDQFGTPSEMVEEPKRLVREAPQEEEWPGQQAPHREGPMGAQKPLLLQK